jgi:hypothetical protein
MSDDERLCGCGYVGGYGSVLALQNCSIIETAKYVVMMMVVLPAEESIYIRPVISTH